MGRASLKKPVVVFTSFWDANFLVDQEFFLHDIEGKPNLIWLKNKAGKPFNYSVNSIALRAPSLSKLKAVQDKCGKMEQLKFFCPTYAIFSEQKNNPDWDYYTEKFKNVMRERKQEVFDWVDSLENNKIYFLCCWESTGGNTHCHREIIYNAFNNNPIIKGKVTSLYRHGRSKLDDNSAWENIFDKITLDALSGPSKIKHLSQELNKGKIEVYNDILCDQLDDIVDLDLIGLIKK